MEDDTNIETFFDIVVTKSDANSPRYIAGSRSPVLFVASGRHASWLFRPEQGLTVARTRVLFGGNRIAVTVNATGEADILRVLRDSGLYYSAFGEEKSYPAQQACIIRHWEDEDDRSSGHSIDTVSAARRDGLFLWLRVPPGESNWHRQCVSHGILRMDTEESAKLFLKYLEIPRVHQLSSPHIVAMVFDPDLGLGDFSIDVRNEEALPIAIRKAVKEFLAEEKQVTWDFARPEKCVVPTEFSSGIFDM